MLVKLVFLKVLAIYLIFITSFQQCGYQINVFKMKEKDGFIYRSIKICQELKAFNESFEFVQKLPIGLRIQT